MLNFKNFRLNTVVDASSLIWTTKVSIPREIYTFLSHWTVTTKSKPTEFSLSGLRTPQPRCCQMGETSKLLNQFLTNEMFASRTKRLLQRLYLLKILRSVRVPPSILRPIQVSPSWSRWSDPGLAVRSNFCPCLLPCLLREIGQSRERWEWLILRQQVQIYNFVSSCKFRKRLIA